MGEPEALSARSLWVAPSVRRAGGIEADVVEVDSLEQVEALGEAGIQGRIVFFNRASGPGQA